MPYMVIFFYALNLWNGLNDPSNFIIEKTIKVPQPQPWTACSMGRHNFCLSFPLKQSKSNGAIGIFLYRVQIYLDQYFCVSQVAIRGFWVKIVCTGVVSCYQRSIHWWCPDKAVFSGTRPYCVKINGQEWAVVFEKVAGVNCHHIFWHVHFATAHQGISCEQRSFYTATGGVWWEGDIRWGRLPMSLQWGVFDGQGGSGIGGWPLRMRFGWVGSCRSLECCWCGQHCAALSPPLLYYLFLFLIGTILCFLFH